MSSWILSCQDSLEKEGAFSRPCGKHIFCLGPQFRAKLIALGLQTLRPIESSRYIHRGLGLLGHGSMSS